MLTQTTTMVVCNCDWIGHVNNRCASYRRLC